MTAFAASDMLRHRGSPQFIIIKGIKGTKVSKVSNFSLFVIQTKSQDWVSTVEARN